MALNMPHGSMKRPCGKSTYKFLYILKEFESKFVHVCIKIPFWCRWSSQIHKYETSYLICIGSLEGKWDNLRDCSVEKGVHFLGLYKMRGMINYCLEL
jgi:hypothetical protein